MKKILITIAAGATLGLVIGACTTANISSDNTNADIATQSKPATAERREVTTLAARSQLKNSARMAKLHSIAPRPLPASPIDREHYSDIATNPVVDASTDPVSTFSIDVDTASYSNIRRIIAAEGRLPPRDAVRIEEMINYFSYDYQPPASVEQPFTVTTELAPAPWNASRQLLQIGLKGFAPENEKLPPANLVFLIDVSGSMQARNKLPLVKQSLKLLLNNLNPDDRIALAVYAGAAGLVLDSTPASDKAKVLAAIDQLQAGGSTHGSAGIELAYQVAQQNFIADGINRVLIASDGDMNVGITSIDALKELIEQKRKSGIALTTLGYGSGNYNYSLMEQLADVGDGNASYIDNLKEAYKVLVRESRSTLLTIAKDVKIQIEFNPALVAEYRLLGYENRLLANEDFTNDKVDAGDIGAGHTVTALYEITPVASAARRLPVLRYQPAKDTTSASSDEIAFVKLRYKRPGEDQSTEITRAVSPTAVQPFDQASESFRFASAVAGFGQLLRGGKYLDSFDFQRALAIMRDSRGSDAQGYRSELISLVELASVLSATTASGG